MFVADFFRGLVLASLILGEQLAENEGMILKGEVGHEAQRSLGESDHWWHVDTVELLSSIENCAISTKRNDVIDLLSAFFRQIPVGEHLFRDAELLQQRVVFSKRLVKILMASKLDIDF